MSAVTDPLTNTSARALEFESLRELLGAYAASPLGQGGIAGLAPSSDLGFIRRQQQLTAEVRAFLRNGGRFEFSGLLDPGVLVARSRIEGEALEVTEIRDVVLVVDRAAEWREIALHPPAALGEWPAVRALADGIADFTARSEERRVGKECRL